MDCEIVKREACWIRDAAGKLMDYINNGDSKNAQFQVEYIERRMAVIRKEMGPVGA